MSQLRKSPRLSQYSEKITEAIFLLDKQFGSSFKEIQEFIKPRWNIRDSEGLLNEMQRLRYKGKLLQRRHLFKLAPEVLKDHKRQAKEKDCLSDLPNGNEDKITSSEG